MPEFTPAQLQEIQAQVTAALAAQEPQAPPAVPQADMAAAAAAAVAAIAPAVTAVDINAIAHTFPPLLAGRRRGFFFCVRGGVREQENHPRRDQVQQTGERADARGKIVDGRPSPGAGDESGRLPDVER